MIGPRERPPTDVHPPPGPSGVYREIILNPDRGYIHAELEDDFHHFRVKLWHEEGRILRVNSAALRFPWTLCPDACPTLEAAMTGRQLNSVGIENHRLHCTHLFDLACLAAAHAHDDSPTRFSVFVSDRVRNRARASLARDNVLEFEWTLEGENILPPSPHAGFDLRQPANWLPSLPFVEREAVQMLRRALLVANARKLDLEHKANAGSIRERLGGCYVFQPGRADRALPVCGSRRDFTTGNRPFSNG